MSNFVRAWAFRFVWLFAFTLTWESSVEIGGVGLAKIAGLLGLGSGLCAVIVSGRMRKPHRAQIVMLGYLFWVIITYLFSSSPEHSFPDVLLYVQLVGVAFLVYEFVSNEKEQTSVLQALVLGSIVSIMRVLTSFSHPSAQNAIDAGRYSGGGDPNDVAMFLSLATCTALYLSTVRKERAWRWFNTCIIPPILLAIALTGSRGGLVTLLVALSVIPAVVMTRRKIKRQLLVMGAIVVLSSAALLVVPGGTWDRLSTTGDEIMHGTLTGRTDIWRAGLGVFADHPIVGAGTGTFAMEVAPVTGVAIVAHNLYLELLAEQGIVGFGLFAAIIVTLLLPFNKLPIPQRRFWFILLGVFMVGAMDLSLGRKKILWFLLGMIAAQVASATTRRMELVSQRLPDPDNVIPRMGLPARCRAQRRSLNPKMEER